MANRFNLTDEIERAAEYAAAKRVADVPLRALEDARPEPDCRTCVKYSVAGNSCWTLWPAQVPCKDGDHYESLPPVRLWRTT